MGEDRNPKMVWARFGAYEMDHESGLRSVKGYGIKLQPQPLRVLTLLVQRAPEVVTREELGDHIWGKGVHVELDANVNYCIRQIRQALDDTASEAKYIETLPRQGYRFVAAVEKFESVVEVLQPAEQPTLPIKDEATRVSRRQLIRWAGLCAGGAAAAVGAGFWLDERWHRGARPGAVHVKVEMLEGTDAADPDERLGAPVVSPDGSSLVLSLSTRDGKALFLRALGGSGLTKIAGTEGGRLPFWSPDSQTIGFFAAGRLKRIAVSGGSAVTLCEAGEPRGGSWGSKGDVLFAVNVVPKSTLFKVSEQGGEPVQVTTLDRSVGENSHRYPVFLPDGKRFLYFARTDQVDHRAVYLQSLDGKQPRQRVMIADGAFALGRDSDRGNDYLLSPQAGKIMAQKFDVASGRLKGAAQVLLQQPGEVSASKTGVLVVRTQTAVKAIPVWRDRKGRELARVGGADDYRAVAVSENGRYVSVIRHDSSEGTFQVWVAGMPYGKLEPFSKADHVGAMAWSPDGKLHYSDFRLNALYQRGTANGEVEVKERDLAPDIYIGDYSRDGRFMSAEISQDRASGKVVWSPVKDGHWRALDATGVFGVRPVFSPDGRWLAFSSNERGESELYLTSLPVGSTRQRISTGGGRCPRWRADGRELFYLSESGNLMSVTVNGDTIGPAKPLFHARTGRSPFEVPYDVSPDGQRFLILEADSENNGGGVEMILNWPSLLA